MRDPRARPPETDEQGSPCEPISPSDAGNDPATWLTASLGGSTGVTKLDLCCCGPARRPLLGGPQVLDGPKDHHGSQGRAACCSSATWGMKLCPLGSKCCSWTDDPSPPPRCASEGGQLPWCFSIDRLRGPGMEHKGTNTAAASRLCRTRQMPVRVTPIPRIPGCSDTSRGQGQRERTAALSAYQLFRRQGPWGQHQQHPAGQEILLK